MALGAPPPGLERRAEALAELGVEGEDDPIIPACTAEDAIGLGDRLVRVRGALEEEEVRVVAER
jgi:hypothetical protein